jgi:hypothetical protein
MTSRIRALTHNKSAMDMMRELDATPKTSGNAHISDIQPTY